MSKYARREKTKKLNKKLEDYISVSSAIEDCPEYPPL